MKQHVLLFHGLWRTRASMAAMAWRLRRAGNVVTNVGYDSYRLSLEQAVRQVHATIGKALEDTANPPHFVGFSLGGLVIRAYLHAYPKTRVGRVVLIGTPNARSPLADAAKDRWYYRRLLGPAGQQLVTDRESVKHLFGMIAGEVGVIAGSLSWEPWTWRHFQGANDGKVSVESAKLEGMKDYLVLPLTHTQLPISKRVHRQVIAFLQNGRFNP